MKLSIIVCTYNRAEVLRECLEALCHQTANDDEFQVLVVNNNSKDHTIEVAQEYADKKKNFHLITELKQGLSHARNAGYLAVDTEWVGYIDDDAKARPNYIERALWIIENHDYDAFGGIDEPWYQIPKPFWYNEKYIGSRLNYSELSLIKPGEFVTGFSMFFKKADIVKVNGFSVELGMTGDKVAYHEEIDLQHRLREITDIKIAYDPELIVDHLVLEHKLSLDWFFISSFALGRDSVAMNKNSKSILELILIFVVTIGFTFLRMLFYTPKLLLPKYYVQNWMKDVFRKTAKRVGILYTVLKDRKG